MNTLGEYIFAFVIGLAGCVIFGVVPIIWLAETAESHQCEVYSEVTGRETKYRAGTCFIKDGEWYAWGEYKRRGGGK